MDSRFSGSHWLKLKSFCFYLIKIILLSMPERRKWTPEEDEILSTLRNQRKIERWSQISDVMKSEFQIQGRSGRQCRERYTNHLDPRISKRPWTLQETLDLFRLHDQYGSRWAQIARLLSGRTENCVKNQFYSHLRKQLHAINLSLHQHYKPPKQIKLSLIGKMVAVIQKYYQQKTSILSPLLEQSNNLKNLIIRFQDTGDDVQKLENIYQSVSQFNLMAKTKLKRKKDELFKCEEPAWEVTLGKHSTTMEQNPAQQKEINSNNSNQFQQEWMLSNSRQEWGMRLAGSSDSNELTIKETKDEQWMIDIFF